MNQRRSLVAPFLLALAVISCGGKETGAEKTSSAHADAGKTDPAAGSTAEQPGQGEGPVNTECPKSLSGTENQSRVITKDCGVVQVTGEYFIDGGTLTLEAGATLAFQDGARLSVGYTQPSKLIVKGTAEAPVTFTAAGDKTPGVWGGVTLYQSANRSSLEGLVLEYAGEENGYALEVAAKDVVIKGSTIKSSRGVGIAVTNDGTLAELSGNSFEATGKAALHLPPAQVAKVRADNKFSEGALVQVEGGLLSGNSRWEALGADYLITREIDLSGDEASAASLEIAAGARLRFTEGGTIWVGYSRRASLKVSGTPESPVLFTAADAQTPGAWGALQIYGNGEADLSGAIFEYGGAEEERGVLHVEGTASIRDCTFRNNRAGLVVSEMGKLKTLERSTFTANEKGAITLPASAFGALDGSNTYDEAARIRNTGGDVAESASWRAQGAPTEVTRDIYVTKGATLTIEAGSNLLFGEETSLYVGYTDPSTLILAGTTENPVRLGGARDESGSWGGVRVEDKSRGSKLENVTLRAAGGQAGVFVTGSGEVSISGLRCEKCAQPALSYDCEAKVTAEKVVAAEGTPAGEKKPENCN